MGEREPSWRLLETGNRLHLVTVAASVTTHDLNDLNSVPGKTACGRRGRTWAPKHWANEKTARCTRCEAKAPGSTEGGESRWVRSGAEPRT